MESAFGIEHGGDEVSKARRRRGAPRQPSPVVQSLHSGYVRAATAGNKAASTRVSLSDVGRGTGAGLKNAGNISNKILTKKPGLAGAAIVSGAGYSLYRVNSKDKKKSVPKGM